MAEEAPKSKFLLGLGMALSAMLLGLFAGGLLGGQMVSKADGMAGAVEVLAFALVGGVVLLIVSIVLVRQLPRRISKRILLVIGPMALVLLTYSTWRFMRDKAERDRRWEIEQERYKHLKPTAPAMKLISLSPAWMEVDRTDGSIRWVRWGSADFVM